MTFKIFKCLTLILKTSHIKYVVACGAELMRGEEVRVSRQNYANEYNTSVCLDVLELGKLPDILNIRSVLVLHLVVVCGCSFGIVSVLLH